MKTMLIMFLRAMEKQGHTGAILIKSEKKCKILEVWKKTQMFALCNEKMEISSISNSFFYYRCLDLVNSLSKIKYYNYDEPWKLFYL